MFLLSQRLIWLRQTDRQIDRQTDRQIYRQTDRQIDRQTDRQIDRHGSLRVSYFFPLICLSPRMSRDIFRHQVWGGGWSRTQFGEKLVLAGKLWQVDRILVCFSLFSMFSFKNYGGEQQLPPQSPPQRGSDRQICTLPGMLRILQISPCCSLWGRGRAAAPPLVSPSEGVGQICTLPGMLKILQISPCCSLWGRGRAAAPPSPSDVVGQTDMQIARDAKNIPNQPQLQPILLFLTFC